MDPKTSQVKARNEKVKRAYFAFLRDAKGFSPLTVEAMSAAL
jgi:hypothetical protein